MTKAVVLATLMLVLLAAGDRLDPIREGLNGTYYANAAWTEPPARSTVDPQPSNASLLNAWRGSPPPVFSATWAGSLLVMRNGPYAIATLSDDGSAVYVDGQAVVDNAGRREGPRGLTNVVTLTRGVHQIHVRYQQDGGPFHFELLWARAGEPLERIPAWALTPRRASFGAFALSAGLRQSLAAAEWIWVATLVIWAGTIAWAWMRRGRAWLEHDQSWGAMRWLLATSLALNATAVWWGLPAGGWAPDEVSPVLVRTGAAVRFAHGWFDRYPPFHYFVLTAAESPVLLLEWLGRVDTSATLPFAALALIGRLVSIAAGAGTLAAIYACGARTFGKRAGLFAAAMFALVVPFVYYAKTSNLDVPYLFWFAVSLVFYLRALENGQVRDFAGFAACGMLAICTKDQAYGLYLLMPFALVQRLWEVKRGAGERRPLLRALVDRRMRWAAAVAVAVFVLAHNILFNPSGFWSHVQFILGPASETYRDFPRTLAGRLALFRLTVDIVRVMWGWPMFVAALAGVVLALSTPRHRRTAVWLALPVVSYYAGFINVVLYNYDRFMLPACLVLSLFGGLAFDRWLSSGGGRPWRAAAAGSMFAVSLLYAATVDLVMLRDSRYAVEQWLAPRVGPGDMVGFVFPLQYYPRLERFNSAEITSIGGLQDARPAYYVLNADYARAEPPGSEIGRLIAGLQNGQLGYRLVFRDRRPAPPVWQTFGPRDLVGDRNERPITSVLRHINPWYEVFKRGS